MVSDWSRRHPANSSSNRTSSGGDSTLKSNDLVREAGTMKRWVRRVRAGFLAIDRTYGAGVARLAGGRTVLWRACARVANVAMREETRPWVCAAVCATTEGHVFGHGAGNLIPKSFHAAPAQVRPRLGRPAVGGR